MKSVVFDAGPVISLTMNNLLWLLEPLKKKFRGNFLITPWIRYELVEKPLGTKRFEFEALQVLYYIKNNILKIADNEEIREKTNVMLELANNSFLSGEHPIKIVQRGEVEALATSIVHKSDAFVVDERTLRLLVEDPEKLKNILQGKLHSRISIDKNVLDEFRKMAKDVKIIRSVELVLIAYESGMLDKFLPDTSEPNRVLLDAVLWGMKIDGCSVSKKEINQLIKAEIKR